MRRLPHGYAPLPNCETCLRRHEEWFCQVPASALRALDSVAFANVFPEGSVLFSEGEQVRALYLLCSGSVKLSVASDDGKTLITHIAHGGEALGLASVVTGHTYKTTAETIEPSQVKVIRYDDFHRLVAEYAAVSHQSTRQLANECESINEDLRTIGLSHSAAEKLAHLIVTWCDESGRESPEGVRVPLLVTHHDISQLVGTSRETVTRLLHDFRERGVVSVHGSTMIVHDRAALEALVST